MNILIKSTCIATSRYSSTSRREIECVQCGVCSTRRAYTHILFWLSLLIKMEAMSPTWRLASGSARKEPVKPARAHKAIVSKWCRQHMTRMQEHTKCANANAHATGNSHRIQAAAPLRMHHLHFSATTPPGGAVPSTRRYVQFAHCSAVQRPHAAHRQK